jgi:hypothetical protein
MRIDGRSGIKDPKSHPYDVERSQLSYRLTFGLFRGYEIVSVPSEYLRKLRHTCYSIDIAKRCTDELERRHRIIKSVKSDK